MRKYVVIPVCDLITGDNLVNGHPTWQLTRRNGGYVVLIPTEEVEIVNM